MEAIPSAVSARLVQILRTYCAGPDTAGIADLRESLAMGRYRWLFDELNSAISAQAFTPRDWEDCVKPAGWSSPRATDAAIMQRDQLRIWSQLFPGQPFPLDEVTVQD